MKLKVVSGIVLILLMTSIVILLTSPIPVIAQTNSMTMVYLDPPTINGTVVGQEFNVSIMICDGQNIYAWQAGLTFNPDLLECTGFHQGEFLKNVGPTIGVLGTINNATGMIFPPGACTLVGEVPGATGDGRLAYATFKVKAPGVSDIHLIDVKVLEFALPPKPIPVNIIDVYTVIWDATAHTVVTISNSTILHTGFPGTRFYGHSFNLTLEEVSFNVAGPNPGFSNVTIPKTLLNVSTLDEWMVTIDGNLLSIEERTVTENDTHTSIYFTYTRGYHKIQITSAHTLTIYSSPTGVTFTVDGVSRTTPWSGTYTAGTSVSLIMPEIHTVGDARYYWDRWSDGNTSRSRTVTMNTNITLTAHYTGPYYETTVEGKTVVIESNITVANRVITKNTLRFNATGPTGSTGWINVTFPMVNTTEIEVFVDEVKLTPPPFPIITTNGTHYFIYFEFTLSTHTITIQFGSTLPVGGIYISVNKLALLAPYIGLTILLAVAVTAVGYIKKRKRKT